MPLLVRKLRAWLSPNWYLLLGILVAAPLLASGAPTITRVSPETTAPRGIVTLYGKNFGRTKPTNYHIRMFSLPGRKYSRDLTGIRYWSDREIRIQLSARTLPGDYGIEIFNGIRPVAATAVSFRLHVRRARIGIAPSTGASLTEPRLLTKPEVGTGMTPRTNSVRSRDVLKSHDLAVTNVYAGFAERVEQPRATWLARDLQINYHVKNAGREAFPPGTRMTVTVNAYRGRCPGAGCRHIGGLRDLADAIPPLGADVNSRSRAILVRDVHPGSASNGSGHYYSVRVRIRPSVSSMDSNPRNDCGTFSFYLTSDWKMRQQHFVAGPCPGASPVVVRRPQR